MKKPTVINIKDAPQGWVNDPQYVYIGRERTIAGKHFDGYWGNPHPVGYNCSQCKDANGKPVIHQQGEAVKAYETTLKWKLQWMDGLANKILELGDKTLVCFCKPNACHGDVLADMYDVLKFEQVMEEIEEEDKEHQTHIITTKLGSGWAAVQLWWNTTDIPDQPFWEPFQTGIGRYDTAEEAEVEAKDWADSEEQEYRGIQ